MGEKYKNSIAAKIEQEIYSKKKNWSPVKLFFTAMLFWNSSGHLLDTTNPELSYFKLSYLFEEHKDSVGRGTSVQSSLRLMPIAFHSAWHRPYQVHISLIKDETTINLFFGSVSSQSKNKICSCRCQKNLEVTFVRKIRLSPNKPAV